MLQVYPYIGDNKFNLSLNNIAANIIQNNNDGILVYDKDGVCIIWNPSMEKISGIEKDAIVGKYLFDFIEHFQLTLEDSYFQRTLRDEEFIIESNEFHFINRKERGFYNAKYLPIKDEAGKVVGGMAIVQEITSQVETIIENKENKQLLIQSQEIAGIGSYEYDLRKNKVKLSGEICKFLNIRDNLELEYEKFEELVFLEDREFLKNELIESIRNKSHYDVEYRHMIDDVTFRYVWIKGKIIYSQAGRAERVIGASMDITEKKMIEEEFRNKNIAILNAYKKLEGAQKELKVLNNDLEKIVEKRTRELYISQERFKLVSYATNDAIWDWDILNNKVWWSESFKTIFGVENEPRENGVDLLYERIHPDDVERVKDSFRKVMTDKLTQNQLEYRVVKDDGSIAFIYDRSYTLVDENGIPVRMIGSLMDLTPLKTVQQELFLKNQELKKVNEYLDNFVYAAAHDLRSPVANLKLLFNLLEKTSDMDGKLKYLEAIEKAVNRLDKTLNGLVQVIEIQSQSGNVYKLINFNTILDGLKAEFATSIVSKRAKIIADFSACSFINYIEAYMISIIKNLISNAIKYSSDDKIPLIKLHTQKEDDFIILTIQDNGIGIDLEKYGQNLFKPFNRFTNKAEGQGIGLHLIKSMVEKNGGKIEVQSSPDNGTKFIIFLKEF
jgi:PAS domain S-box-containing protein